MDEYTVDEKLAFFATLEKRDHVQQPMHVRGANILVVDRNMSNEEWVKFDKMMMEKANTVSQKDVDDFLQPVKNEEK